MTIHRLTLIVLLGTACGDSPSAAGVEGTSCRNSRDCEEGLLCHFGTCARSCNTASDCGSNQICMDGACTARVLGELGSSCSDGNRCESGICAAGVCCSSACDGPCEACGTDGVCDVVPPDDEVCGVLDCDELDTDCRDYHDIDTGRCAGLGVCKLPNDATTCSDYADALSGTLCADTRLCTEGDACDGSGSCVPGAVTLCGPSPLVRYWMAEALSGQPVGAHLLDEQVPSLDLPLTYVGASPVFAVGPYGDRGLMFVGVGGVDTGGASASIAGTKLAQLEGASRATLELKYATQGCSSDNVVVFGIDGTGGDLLVGQTEGEGGLVTRWQGDASLSRYSLGAGCPFERAAVVHWVIDTSEPVAADRVRAYVDGMRQTVLPLTGSFPDAGATLTLGTDARIKVGRPGAAAAFRGRVWYAALYEDALSPTALWTNAARLNANDDRRVSHGVVSKSIGTGARDFPTLAAWEAARDGGLPTRVVLWVTPIAGRFEAGEIVTGEGTCTGEVVLEDDLGTNAERMTLDNPTGECAPGALLTGSNSGATARLLEVLIAGGTIERGWVYADSVYTSGLEISGSQSDAEHYLWLTAAPGHRHRGIAGTGVVIDPDVSGHVIAIDQPHTLVEWLEVTGWPNAEGDSYEGVSLLANADGSLLQYLLIHDDDWIGRTTNPNGDAINLNQLADGATATIRNTLIYNISRAGIQQQNEVRAVTVNVENCTILRTALSGSQADGDGGVAINGANPDGTASIVNVSNTVVLDTCPDTVVTCTRVTPDFDAGWSENSVAPDWGDSHHNASSDATAPGSDAVTGVAAASTLASAAYGSEDLHLAGGASLIGVGSAPSYPTCEDIDLEPRPQGGGWDIGADERL